jgi:hypothetical protein
MTYNEIKRQELIMPILDRIGVLDKRIMALKSILKDLEDDKNKLNEIEDEIRKRYPVKMTRVVKRYKLVEDDFK